MKDPARIYIIMEPAGDLNLSQFLNKYSIMLSVSFLFLINVKENKKNLLLFNIIQAVQCIHSKGITHNDLKPENIMIDYKLSIKIIDFGFSTKKNGRTNMQKLRRGTPLYLSPEKIQPIPHNGKFNQA